MYHLLSLFFVSRVFQFLCVCCGAVSNDQGKKGRVCGGVIRYGVVRCRYYLLPPHNHPNPRGEKRRVREIILKF